MLLEEIKKIDSSPKKLKEFGWVMSAFFGLLGGVLLLKHRPSAPVYGAVSAVFLLLTLTAPFLLNPLQRVWMTLAVIMGWFMSRVILCILFYLAITPIALILRLSGKDLLDIKLDPSAKTYWKIRDPSLFTRTSCEKQF